MTKQEAKFFRRKLKFPTVIPCSYRKVSEGRGAYNYVLYCEFTMLETYEDVMEWLKTYHLCIHWCIEAEAYCNKEMARKISQESVYFQRINTCEWPAMGY